MKRGWERKIKKRLKRGLSTIVVTLIIILVSLVAVGIVWVVVRNVIQKGSEEVTMGQFTLSAKIMNVNLNNVSNDVNLTVRRNAGAGEFTGLKFLFYDRKDSEAITEAASLEELEERRFNFHLIILNVSKLASISIAPVLNQKGKETIGNILDTYHVNEGSVFLDGNGSVLQINFVLPTPSDGSTQSSNAVYVNVSTNDTNNHSAFIDWNRSLVGWWNFESVNPSGVVADSSTWGNNGILMNHLTNTTITGVRGKALSFDGINDYVNVSYNQNLNLTNRMTVEAWFYHFSDTVWNPIVTRDNYNATKRSWTVRVITSNNLSFSVFNRTSSVIATKSIINPLNTWHHFAAVCNGTSLILYVDGVPGIPVSFSGNINDTDVELIIGMGAATNHYWNGSIDEVMIFNRVLTPEEINATYNAGIYKLYKNFTNLASGSYDYRAWAIDSLGNIGKTEERSVVIQ